MAKQRISDKSREGKCQAAKQERKSTAFQVAGTAYAKCFRHTPPTLPSERKVFQFFSLDTPPWGKVPSSPTRGFALRSATVSFPQQTQKCCLHSHVTGMNTVTCRAGELVTGGLQEGIRCRAGRKAETEAAR